MSKKIVVCRRCHQLRLHCARGLCRNCINWTYRNMPPSERNARYPMVYYPQVEHGACYNKTRQKWCAWGITRTWGGALDKPDQVWILGFCATRADAERIAADWRRAVEQRLGVSEQDRRTELQLKAAEKR